MQSLSPSQYSNSVLYLAVLPKTVIKQIDKYRKHWLWRGLNINAKQPPKAAWSMVCLLKEEECLEVLNLATQNEALLIKNLHKFFTKVDAHGYTLFGRNVIEMASCQTMSKMLLLVEGYCQSLG